MPVVDVVVVKVVVVRPELIRSCILFFLYGTYFPSGGIEKGQRIGRYYTERFQWPSDLHWSRPVRVLRGHWIEVSLHPNPQKMITI